MIKFFPVTLILLAISDQKILYFQFLIFIFYWFFNDMIILIPSEYVFSKSPQLFFCFKNAIPTWFDFGSTDSNQNTQRGSWVPTLRVQIQVNANQSELLKVHNRLFLREYLVDRWVRGCAAQIGCLFGLSGLPMAPFYLKIGLDIT